MSFKEIKLEKHVFVAPSFPSLKILVSVRNLLELNGIVGEIIKPLSIHSSIGTKNKDSRRLPEFTGSNNFKLIKFVTTKSGIGLIAEPFGGEEDWFKSLRTFGINPVQVVIPMLENCSPDQSLVDLANESLEAVGKEKRFVTLAKTDKDYNVE